MRSGHRDLNLTTPDRLWDNSPQCQVYLRSLTPSRRDFIKIRHHNSLGIHPLSVRPFGERSESPQATQEDIKFHSLPVINPVIIVPFDYVIQWSGVKESRRGVSKCNYCIFCFNIHVAERAMWFNMESSIYGVGWSKRHNELLLPSLGKTTKNVKC